MSVSYKSRIVQVIFRCIKLSISLIDFFFSIIDTQIEKWKCMENYSHFWGFYSIHLCFQLIPRIILDNDKFGTVRSGISWRTPEKNPTEIPFGEKILFAFFSGVLYVKLFKFEDFKKSLTTLNCVLFHLEAYTLCLII